MHSLRTQRPSNCKTLCPAPNCTSWPHGCMHAPCGALPADGWGAPVRVTAATSSAFQPGDCGAGAGREACCSSSECCASAGNSAATSSPSCSMSRILVLGNLLQIGYLSESSLAVGSGSGHKTLYQGGWHAACGACTCFALQGRLLHNMSRSEDTKYNAFGH